MTNQEKEKLYKQIGENIRVRRNEMGLTQMDFSKKVGLSRASIVNIEQGRQHPYIHLLWDISEVLNVNIQQLIPLKKDLLENIGMVIDLEKITLDFGKENTDKVSEFIKQI